MIKIHGNYNSPCNHSVFYKKKTVDYRCFIKYADFCLYFIIILANIEQLRNKHYRKLEKDIPFKSWKIIQKVKIALSMPFMLNSVLELQNDLAEPSNALNIPPCIAHNQKTISAVIHSHFQGNVF